MQVQLSVPERAGTVGTLMEIEHISSTGDATIQYRIGDPDIPPAPAGMVRW